MSYYGQPMLKPSVWGIDIPLYYFLGGAAGAAMTLNAAVQLAGDRKELRRLSARCHWIAIAGSTAGAVCLIHDLGRPSRFLYMLRVFRPTSPMNMGAWILSGAAPAAIGAALPLGAISQTCGYVAGVFGAGLATYTGVLVSNSVIPVWQAPRRWMPVLFAASAVSAAGSMLELFDDGAAPARIVTCFATAGRVVEIAAAQKVESLSGKSSLLWKASTALTVASLALTLLPGKSQRKRQAAGILGAAGSLCLRLAVHYLSKQNE